MAYATVTKTEYSFLERALTAGAALLESAADRHAEYRVFRTTMNELNALSNRDLADLGIHRSEIKRIAREAAKGQL